MEISLMSVEALAEPFSASVVPYDLTLYYVPQDYSAAIQLWLWKYYLEGTSLDISPNAV